ncbi:MAG TPA: hypothetical protein VI565_12235 [Burkholderiales bacterium]|nr:hypothetical protein [Burkholderiales bacterium]
MSTAVAVSGCTTPADTTPPPPQPPPPPGKPTVSTVKFDDTVGAPSLPATPATPTNCDTVPESCKTHKVPVRAMATAIAATLEWVCASNTAACVPDLDMVVLDPRGEDASQGASSGSGQPEKFSQKRPGVGDWSFRVMNFAGAQVAYSLTVQITYNSSAPATNASGNMSGNGSANAQWYSIDLSEN